MKYKLFEEYNEEEKAPYEVSRYWDSPTRPIVGIQSQSNVNKCYVIYMTVDWVAPPPDNIYKIWFYYWEVISEKEINLDTEAEYQQIEGEIYTGGNILEEPLYYLINTGNTGESSIDVNSISWCISNQDMKIILKAYDEQQKGNWSLWDKNLKNWSIKHDRIGKLLRETMQNVRKDQKQVKKCIVDKVVDFYKT